jgi:3-oxoadipate enol-lactonase
MWRAGGYVTGLAGHLVVLVDHCGHGASESANDPARYMPAAFAADVLAVLNDLDIDRFAFMGYSDGARVGYELGARHRDRVVALVSLGGVEGPDEDQQELRSAARAVRAHGIAAILGDEAAPDWLRAQLLDTPAEVVALELEGFAGWSPWPLLEQILAPTLIVAGEHEADSTEEAAAALPNGRAVLLPGLGHLGVFAHGDLVLSEVRPFLSSVLG